MSVESSKAGEAIHARSTVASMLAASAAITSIEDRIFRNRLSRRRLGRRMVFPRPLLLQPVTVAQLGTLRTGGFLLLTSHANYAFKNHSDRLRQPAAGLQLSTLEL